MSTRETCAAVVVTYNRATLLASMLDGLAAQTLPLDAIFVVDNGSSDTTRQVLEARGDLPLHVHHSTANLGGAGGFHLGVRLAHDAGYDRIWLMDDDVVPEPRCLEVLMAHPGPCLAAVREDRDGALVEKAATRFDLRNPLAVHPKRASVDQTWSARAQLPAEVPLDVVSFEGFLVHRRVVDTVGLPDPSYFIFYDDADFALRARRAGYPILGLRDAVLVRQLPFDQQGALATWKAYYMYRNLFAVHFRHGENVLVRLKPFALAAGAVLLSPLRGGPGEARTVVRALRAAWGMRRPPRAPGLPAADVRKIN